MVDAKLHPLLGCTVAAVSAQQPVEHFKKLYKISQLSERPTVYSLGRQVWDLIGLTYIWEVPPAGGPLL